MKDAHANLFVGLTAPSVLPAFVQHAVTLSILITIFMPRGAPFAGAWPSFRKSILATALVRRRLRKVTYQGDNPQALEMIFEELREQAQGLLTDLGVRPPLLGKG
jgi:hypothetical protein